MADEFDVIVVGGGPAGENIAGRCSEGGLSTAVVERELVGGECSYWACIPSKSLLRPGDALAEILRVPGAREAVTGDLDVSAALARRDSMINNFDDKYQVQWLNDTNIELVRGHGRISSPRTVQVESESGDVRTLSALKAVVIATGSSAAVPPIDGLRDVKPWDSRDITTAKQVPRRLLVIGGGVVAVEMAQAWRRLGAEEVTIIERGERLLGVEEPFVGEEIKEAFEAEGITVLTNSELQSVRRSGGDGPVTATLQDGRELTGDEMLVAVGRKPRTEDIGLDVVGLEPGKPVPVDDRLAAEGVDGGWLFAVGDANGRSLLTHMGKYQARILADRILGVDRTAWADDRAVPRVIFTDPQVAAVGLNEASAKKKGLHVRMASSDVGSVSGGSVRGEGIKGTCQIVVDSVKGVIVGATFVGPEVGEMLQSATIAIVGEVPVERLWHAVPSFPTMSEVWLRMLEELLPAGS